MYLISKLTCLGMPFGVIITARNHGLRMSARLRHRRSHNGGMAYKTYPPVHPPRSDS
jgi:hypothetical protein